MPILHPDYLRTVERKPGGWSFKGKLFQKCVPIAVDFYDFELLYGISMEQVITELFRVNGGKLGYYIADLRHKKYYYCGTEWENVKKAFLQMGIGRKDAVDN